MVIVMWTPKVGSRIRLENRGGTFQRSAATPLPSRVRVFVYRVVNFDGAAVVLVNKADPHRTRINLRILTRAMPPDLTAARTEIEARQCSQFHARLR
jgi:hypothetical protein